MAKNHKSYALYAHIKGKEKTMKNRRIPKGPKISKVMKGHRKMASKGQRMPVWMYLQESQDSLYYPIQERLIWFKVDRQIVGVLDYLARLNAE